LGRGQLSTKTVDKYVDSIKKHDDIFIGLMSIVIDKKTQKIKKCIKNNWLIVLLKNEC